MRASSGLVALAIVLGSAAARAQATGSSQNQPKAAPAAVRDRLSPGILLESLDGNTMRLDQVTGKVTIIAVWATWCGPCLSELPQVEALYQSYRNDPDVKVLAVSVDEISRSADRKHVRETAARLGLTLPILLDSSEQLRREVMRDMTGIPILVTLDASLQMHREIGYRSASSQQFVESHRRMVESARAGVLPQDQARPPRPIPLPRMTPAEFQRRKPTVRRMIRQIAPSASDGEVEAMLQDAEARVARGEIVIIRRP